MSRSFSRDVTAVCDRLQREYLAGVSSARADLAELRKAGSLDRLDGSLSPVAVDVMYSVAGEKFLLSAPDDNGVVGTGVYDRAWFVALTLFAQHMESATRSVHYFSEDNEYVGGFGWACGRLAVARRSSDGVARSMRALLSSQTQSQLEQQLRRLVALLRTEGIGLNYGRFALDLALLMMGGRVRDDVLARWADGFHKGQRGGSRP